MYPAPNDFTNSYILSCSRIAVPLLSLLSRLSFPLPRAVTNCSVLSLPLHGLRISRSRGEGASPVHHGERNSTSTLSKLSKTFSASVPHPW